MMSEGSQSSGIPIPKEGEERLEDPSVFLGWRTERFRVNRYFVETLHSRGGDEASILHSFHQALTGTTCP